MSTVYTVNLFRGVCGPYPVNCFEVPVGHRYVVTDISAWPPQVATSPLLGIEFYSYPGAVVLCGWVPPFLQAFRTYRWQGRQAYDSGVTLQCSTGTPSDTPWHVNITGFDLKLP